MKNGILISLLSMVILLGGCQSNDVYLFSYFKGNGEDGLHLAYSKDGYNWNALNDDRPFLIPQLSKDKLMRDPCIIKGADGLYHMVWTISWVEKGIGYASSPDLINWSEQRIIPVMQHEDKARNCWAPEITYDDKSKQYIIYWATTIDGLIENKQDESEDGYNHRMYYVTTPDFKTFSDTKMLYDKGFNVIDASIVPDKGRFVMFLKDETLVPAQKNIRIAFAESLTGPYSEPSEPITGEYWAEGPTSLQMGDTWLVYFDKYKEGKFGAIKSDNLKDWEEVSDRIQLPDGIRHGSIFKVPQDVLENLLKVNR